MKNRHTTNRIRGMTLIEVLVVIAVIALLAAIFLPKPSLPLRNVSRINCVNNLKQIGLAFRIWEGDNGDKYPMQYAMTNNDAMKSLGDGNAYVLWQSISNELSTPKILFCRADTEHLVATNFSIGFGDTNISYFFGLDAVPNEPQMILAGDDNLAVGGKSVQQGILNLATNVPVTWTAHGINLLATSS
jgi:prepilin-type N-terminal cleavage/methylation domain-containing protein